MASMSSVTMIIGLLLTLYGANSYAQAEAKSPTALIPSLFGIGFLILGALAIREQYRKHAMHAAAFLGVLGFLGGAVMGFPKLGKMLAGDLVGQELNKARSQNLLAFTCLVFVILCVNSFIQARRRRDAGAGDGLSLPPR